MVAGTFGFFKPFVQIISKLKDWFHRRKVNREAQRGDQYFNWGLGIESPFYLSTKFSTEQQSITINGFQTAHNHTWPVKYSIVKIGKLGTSITYFDSVIFYGTYSENEFRHTFNIPNGSDYQLEVFNFYKYHSTGKVQIIQN